MSSEAPTQTKPPRWDLTNVYPGLESAEFAAAREKLSQQISKAEAYLSENVLSANASTDPAKLGKLIGEIVNQFNDIFELAQTIGSYLHSFVTTDSHNMLARKLESENEQVRVRLQNLDTRMSAWIGQISPVLDKAIETNDTAKAHTFTLKETAEQSKYLMSEKEETLAAELNLSGASAWGKLQGTVTSQLAVDFELDGQVQKMSMPALINLRSHPDEDVRRRGYEAENEAWKSVEETLAGCLNGVKGSAITLYQRRGREDALHEALDISRIDRDTLKAMLSAVEDSLPMFRKYFKAKAQKLGKEQLAWWDLFAPLGKTDTVYTFDQARELILENFGSFSDGLRAFAQRAFDNNWIDAEQRIGKRGGAFCMGVPAVKESRILSNFDGSLDQVSTVAHELGHGFHNECMYQAGKKSLQRRTPMTMAETASIMCETIVSQAILGATSDPEERLAILETSILGDAQVVVDIYSRFLFESELFERREKSELSADDISDIMLRSQKAAYGDGVDERYLQKYMWTWKPHYYYAGLNFYNFPYTFGLLFGTGLYAIYQQRGAAFIDDYKSLLSSTGEGTPVDLAARFGIDIRQKQFWADSLSIIGKKIEQYLKL